jgi:hypothetical protein
MIFSNLARLLAIAGVVLGLFGVLLGFGVAREFLGPYDVALRRYTTSSSSGQAIDKGIYAILVLVALGTLAEISFLSANDQPDGHFDRGTTKLGHPPSQLRTEGP